MPVPGGGVMSVSLMPTFASLSKFLAAALLCAVATIAAGQELGIPQASDAARVAQARTAASGTLAYVMAATTTTATITPTPPRSSRHEHD